MHYNRKERKNLAKQLGLKNKNESDKQRQERVSRSIIAGDQIHQQFLMQVENDLRNQRVEEDAKILKSLTESFGEAEAKRIMASNTVAAEKRKQKKLLKKKNS
jgi:hypothetical protein